MLQIKESLVRLVEVISPWAYSESITIQTECTRLLMFVVMKHFSIVDDEKIRMKILFFLKLLNSGWRTSIFLFWRWSFIFLKLSNSGWRTSIFVVFGWWSFIFLKLSNSGSWSVKCFEFLKFIVFSRILHVLILGGAVFITCSEPRFLLGNRILVFDSGSWTCGFQKAIVF